MINNLTVNNDSIQPYSAVGNYSLCNRGIDLLMKNRLIQMWDSERSAFGCVEGIRRAKFTWAGSKYRTRNKIRTLAWA